MKNSQTEFKWPYPIKWGEEQRVDTDILVLGGGIAGCWAAIAAAKNKGVSVTLVGLQHLLWRRTLGRER